MKPYLLWSILIVLFIAGCSKSKTPGPVNNGSSNPKLSIVSGNNQTAKVGFFPSDTIRVKVSGTNINVKNYYVEFRGSGCNADLPTSSGIENNGTSVAYYRLAGNVGAQTLQATLIELASSKRLDSVIFNLNGTAPTSGLNFAACTPLFAAPESFAKTGTGRMFVVLGTGKSLFRYSDDDGISWNPVKGLNSLESLQTVRSDGKNQVVVYSTTQGMYYSADNGLTWQLRTVPFKGQSNTSMSYTASGKLFFIARSGGFYYSEDNGINWTELKIAEHGNGLLTPQEGPNGEFYVFASDEGIFKSIDKGVNWSKLPYVTGPSHADGSFAFFVDYSNGWIYKSAQNPSAIYLSKDGGNTYSAYLNADVIANSFTMNNGIIYYEAGSAIYKVDSPNHFVKLYGEIVSADFDGAIMVSNSGNVFWCDVSSLVEYIKP